MSSMDLDSRFISFLREHREEWNQLLGHQSIGVDDLFSTRIQAWVAGPMQTLFLAWIDATNDLKLESAVDSGSLKRLLTAAYDKGLQAIVDSRLRSQEAFVSACRLWECAHRAAPLYFIASPKESYADLLAIFLHLATFPEPLLSKWVEGMSRIRAGANEARGFRLLCHFTAWLAGAAHFRKSLSIAFETLPESLWQQCFAPLLPKTEKSLETSICNHAWNSLASSNIFETGRVGGFAGGSGAFLEPPRAFLLSENPFEPFLVTSGTDRFHLYVDRFGSMILPIPSGDGFPDSSAQSGLIVENSQALWYENAFETNLPELGLGGIAHDETAVLTSPFSHRLHIWGRSSNSIGLSSKHSK